MSRRSRMSPGKRDRRRPSQAQRVLASAPSHSAAVSLPPPPLAAGQTRCPVCRNGATLTPRGNLRRHRDLFDNDCHNKRPAGAALDLTGLPPVVGAGIPKASSRDSLLGVSPNGSCYECGKRIPPGRRLCGRCMARRAS